MTIRALLQNAEHRLAQAGIEDPSLEAGLLMEEAAGIRRAEALAHPEREATDGEQERFEKLLRRREGHEPFALIAGRQEFMGLSFSVEKGVLIPRQDTETLVEEAMLLMHDGMHLLDLCTGSGCVALSLLHYSNDTTAVATDLSPAAVRLAQKNAQDLGLGERVTILQTDLWPRISGMQNGDAVPENGRFDLITVNPPYIPTAVLDTLQTEVRDYDPTDALDGGEDGLSFYRRILKDACLYLVLDGWLVAEIGYDQGEKVGAMFEDAGFHHVDVIRDLGGNDRVVRGCWY